MERFSIHISKKARADMHGILYHIAVHLGEPSTADRLLSRFEEAASSLETMPMRYALVPDSYLASVGFHMTSVGNYLVFYLVDQETKTVNISRVLYGRQNWIQLLTHELSQ